MLKKISFSALLLSLSAVVVAKTTSNPLDNIPKGYTLFKTTTGDLNHDGVDDMVLLIKATKKSGWQKNQFGHIVDKNRRGVMVFLSHQPSKNKPKKYNLVVENLDCFFSDKEDGGVYYRPDLFLEIQNNKLIVDFSHGRYGTWNYTFRLNKRKNDFTLIGYDRSADRGPVPQRVTSINFLTHKMQVLTNKNQDADSDDDFKFYEEWFGIPKKPLYTLSNIKVFHDVTNTFSSMAYNKSKYND